MYQKDQFELLAPGGDLDAIKAAIAAGADAVYCGLDRFNARNRATNITLDLLDGVIELAHSHNCKIFLTLNIMLLESELPAMLRLLQQLQQTQVDGVIVQDLGLASLLKRHFPSLDVHASTQMNTHNPGQMKLLSGMGMSRVNLSRELSLPEITELVAVGREINMLTEVFVHGSYCVGFSGVCYLSSARNGASGNRGRCSQPCREAYELTAAGKQYPLNMKDNSAFMDLPALAAAGVHSLKIEGRIKKPHYVFTTTESWRKQIDALCEGGLQSSDMSSLYTVFNRDFSNGYLMADVHHGMFIDNPRDHAPVHFSKLHKCETSDDIKRVKQQLYSTKTGIMQRMHSCIDAMEVPANKARSLKGTELNIPLPAGVGCKDIRPQLVVILDMVQLQDSRPESTDIHYCVMLPDTLADSMDEVLAAFRQAPGLIPCFPAVVTGKHFEAARTLLDSVRPDWLMTHNLGVAQLAKEMQLPWVAGSQLNIANSAALDCLHNELNACGAVLSKELSGKQMERIVRPTEMWLMATLFEPNHLMTSRQCLLMQSVGCKKQRMNAGCLKRCSKSAGLQNLKDEPYVIHKARGSYNRLYSDRHSYTPELLQEQQGRFTHLIVDLREIPTNTQLQGILTEKLALFVETIAGDDTDQAILQQRISTWQNNHYLKGV
ncbi:U32 family peptidase [Shewanella corallii]|uniref:U32 family peptidase n=1 Tax=Shewanella corallii TaxID=560080 RepID=A0ABT0N3I2_9GAMM|nr:U32 family peptidase [Shewanella corallii]MCL2912352.1 U32 family peptidase [Shewanella corallii]